MEISEPPLFFRKIRKLNPKGGERERRFQLREESNQNLGQDLLAEKNPAGIPKTTLLSVNLNGIKSNSVVRARSYTTL